MGHTVAAGVAAAGLWPLLLPMQIGKLVFILALLQIWRAFQPASAPSRFSDSAIAAATAFASVGAAASVGGGATAAAAAPPGGDSGPGSRLEVRSWCLYLSRSARFPAEQNVSVVLSGRHWIGVLHGLDSSAHGCGICPRPRHCIGAATRARAAAGVSSCP